MAISTPPLAGMRFSLVGPGRVGTSLAAWAVAAGAELLATAGRAELDGMASGGQDLLLIAVPDAALAETAVRLAARPQAAVALHTSGSRDAAVLAPLAAAGSAAGSLHPLKAFPHALPEAGQARGVFFALDGDAAALDLAARLVAAWGGAAGEVPAAARAAYHLAATLAAGGVATLLGTAASLAAAAGLPREVMGGYLELARGTVAEVREGFSTREAAAAAITGPVARGDTTTLARLVAALTALAPERLPLVLELARETLRLLAAAGPLGAGQRELAAWLAAPPERPDRGKINGSGHGGTI